MVAPVEQANGDLGHASAPTAILIALGWQIRACRFNRERFRRSDNPWSTCYLPCYHKTQPGDL